MYSDSVHTKHWILFFFCSSSINNNICNQYINISITEAKENLRRARDPYYTYYFISLYPSDCVSLHNILLLLLNRFVYTLGELQIWATTINKSKETIIMEIARILLNFAIFVISISTWFFLSALRFCYLESSPNAACVYLNCNRQVYRS